MQVGDPFQEKLLLEATLELSKTTAVVGMQDMGAAGITCSTSEMSAAGEVGMDIHLDRVPLRQQDMEPFEILLSESQERMLVVVHKGQEEEVKDIFKKWDLHAEHIGEVTEGDRIRYFMNGELVGDVPGSTLVLGGGAPVYEREYTEPSWYAEAQAFDPNSVPVPSLDECADIAQKLICLPNIASKKWVWEQYDSMVGTINRSTNRPSDAGVVSVRGTDKALALTVDCNARYVEADPEIGTAIAVAEAARNISCTGAEPSAITNCLNFGNPYNPEVYWQFVGAIQGMGRACRHFNTPGDRRQREFLQPNGQPRRLCPGGVPDADDWHGGGHARPEAPHGIGLQREGRAIFQLGGSSGCINASEYLANIVGIDRSPAPHFDIEKEGKLHACLREIAQKGLAAASHDVADGGLFITLLEMAMPNGLGFDIVTDDEVRLDGFLFGEGQGRAVVSLKEEDQDDFFDVCEAHGLQPTLLGHVTKGKVVVDDKHFGFCEELRAYYDNALEEILTED